MLARLVYPCRFDGPDRAAQGSETLGPR
jgi:hypothetical protein